MSVCAITPRFYMKGFTQEAHLSILLFRELELRKSGGKGRFIKDDPRRYPDRENIGFLREPLPLYAFRGSCCECVAVNV